MVDNHIEPIHSADTMKRTKTKNKQRFTQQLSLDLFWTA